MIQTEAFGQFRKGIEYLRDGHALEGLPFMRRAVELEGHNPYYISYLGLMTARAERKWAAGEELCRSALQMRRNEPQLYLNLSEVYVAAGRREDATEILIRGLKNARRDFRLRLALKRLSGRRRPVLPFLARDHFLNRQLGVLRHRALEKLTGAESHT
jgi:Flp pilus assembly protein TadD